MEIECRLWYHAFVQRPNILRLTDLKRGIKTFTAFLFLAGLLLFFASLSRAEPLKWESYKQGMKKGKAENRKIFLNFHADW